MSAPAPPRHTFPTVPSTNGFRDVPAGPRSGPGPSMLGGGDNRKRRSPKPYPHMKDIVYKAETRTDPYASVGQPPISIDSHLNVL